MVGLTYAVAERLFDGLSRDETGHPSGLLAAGAKQMGTDEIVWELEPHTRAKHEILRYYLGAWFPILASVHSRVLYVDGFAGPGEYKGGEDGSPIIALNVAKDHQLQSRFRNELLFLFIEMDIRRAEHLQKKIGTMALPSNFKIRIERSSFENSISRTIAEVTERGRELAPSFFFIDPFGPAGFPMSLLKKISEQPRSEVLINFSYQPLNQWCLEDDSKHALVDSLFGSAAWRRALAISDPKKKEENLREAYQRALEAIGWKVRPFSMINKYNQTQYYLFFATKNALGMLAMKRAMWKAAPAGEFRYSDLSNPAQGNMLEAAFEEQYAQQLADVLYARHKGMFVRKEELLDDLAWDPICIERHLTKALRILESESSPPRVIDVANRKRMGTYPVGSVIHFAA